MKPRHGIPADLWRLAACQGGVVSRSQYLGMGLSPSAHGRAIPQWTRLGPGVYWLAPPLLPPPFETRVWAGILLGGDGARAGLATAAVLHGLAHEDEVASARRRSLLGLDDDRIWIVTTHNRRCGPDFGFVRERTGERLPSRPTEPARTGVEDTTLDLAARGDETDVVTWVTRAVQRRLTTTDRLARRLEDRSRLRHRGLIRELLADVSAGATTPLEVSALRNVFRRHRLPAPELQLRIGGAVVDAGYQRYRVLIELDGRLGHIEEGAFRDRRRDNIHAGLGLVTLRFGWSDVTGDPCGVARQIADVLRTHGWAGAITPCRRCPEVVAPTLADLARSRG